MIIAINLLQIYNVDTRQNGFSKTGKRKTDT
jgi:hypothetical protein